MNVVDWSAWIEYFTEGPNAGQLAKPIERIDELIVASLCLYEVFKWVLRARDETLALKATAQMQQGTMVELDAKLAVLAARLSLSQKLPLADSIVFATARLFEATLWTQDAGFKDIEDVRFVAKVKQ